MATEDQPLRTCARKHAEDEAGSLMHPGGYVAVSAFLVALRLPTGKRGTYPWFVIPMAAWGIGVVARCVGVFAGPTYGECATRRESDRLRSGGPEGRHRLTTSQAASPGGWWPWRLRRRLRLNRRPRRRIVLPVPLLQDTARSACDGRRKALSRSAPRTETRAEDSA